MGLLNSPLGIDGPKLMPCLPQIAELLVPTLGSNAPICAYKHTSTARCAKPARAGDRRAWRNRRLWGSLRRILYSTGNGFKRSFCAAVARGRDAGARFAKVPRARFLS